MRGFSIVEMLVVVAVIGIVATVIVLQLGDTNRSFSIDNARDIVESDIRRVMTWASTGKTCCASEATPEGYGIRFRPNQTSYTIYAEWSGNQKWTPSSTDEVIETVDLLDDELISDVQILACTPGAGINSTCDFFVEVPSGGLYTNGAQSTDLSVTVEQTESGETSVVTVDLTSGQVN